MDTPLRVVPGPAASGSSPEAPVTGSSAATAAAAAVVLMPEDVRALERACSPRSPQGLRDAALIAVLHRRALRLPEALELREDDVDLEAGRLTLARRHCAVALDDETALLLDCWLHVRHRIPGGDAIGPRARLMTPAGAPSLLRELRRRARCSQAELARQLGYGQKALSRWELGDLEFPPGVWERATSWLLERAGPLDDLAERLAAIDDAPPGLPAGSPLFCSIPAGRPLSPKSVQSRLRALGSTAGVRTPVTPDALRRARVYELATGGTRLRELHRLLDYDEPAATRSYVATIAPASRAASEPEPTRPPRPERHLAALPDGPPRLAGVPIDDPAWAEVRRGRRPPNFGRKLEPEPLTEEEALAMLHACADHARTPETAARNQALFVVLWRAGLRIGETVGRHHKVTGEWIPGLLPKDVDLVSGALRVMRGKGDKFRTAGIDPVGAAFLQRWLDVRLELGIPTTVELFCTLQRSSRHGPVDEPRPLSAPYVRNLLKAIGRRAGVDKRIHPHGMRHTHTFELAMEGTPIILIRDQLGHESLATTDKYLRRIAPVQLLRAMHARSFPGTDEP